MIESLDAAARAEWATVLYLSLQGGLSGLCALVAVRILHRFSPAQRSAVLLAGLAGFVVPLRSLLPGLAVTPRIDLVHGSVAGIDPVALSLGALHVAGIAVALVALTRQRLGLARILRSARPLAGGLRAPGSPRIVQSEQIVVPFAARPLAPVVVLPAELVRRMSARRVAHVIGHERAHVRHGDLWINLVVASLRAVFWFHPVARVLGRALLDTREELADDAVLLEGCTPVDYGETLVDAAAFLSGAPQVYPRVALTGGEVDRLASRLRRLGADVRGGTRRWTRRTAVLAVTVAIASVLVAFVPEVQLERARSIGTGHGGHAALHRTLHRS